LLDHLDVWVLREAILADRGEVRGFPTRAVEILLDLRRHLGPLKAILWIVGIDFAMRVVYSIKDEEGGALGLFGKAEGRTKFKIPNRSLTIPVHVIRHKNQGCFRIRVPL
jgi:hypothetical protein